MKRDRIGRPLAGRVVGLALIGLTAAGCAAGGREPPVQPPTPQKVSAGQVCAGLFPAEGGSALERVLDSRVFQLLDEKRNPDVRDVAQAMENAYRAGKDIRNMPQSTCEIAGSEREHRIPRARLRFTASSKHADFPGVSDRGVDVSTRERKTAHLSYDCVSFRVGSTQDIPLRIRLMFHERWDDSKSEAVLRADYLTITHSAAMAVAKELQCADNGGLPPHAEELPMAETP